jgi:hypothetical protein
MIVFDVPSATAQAAVGVAAKRAAAWRKSFMYPTTRAASRRLAGY